MLIAYPLRVVYRRDMREGVSSQCYFACFILILYPQEEMAVASDERRLIEGGGCRQDWYPMSHINFCCDVHGVFVFQGGQPGTIKKGHKTVQKKADAHIEDHDRAVHELKVQRDRLNKYIANV